MIFYKDLFMTDEEFKNLYTPQPQYTASEYLRELDKKIPLETNSIIYDCLKQLRGGYLCECMQYPVNTIDAIITYICHGKDQTFGDIDQINIAQRFLKLYYDDMQYYYDHYYDPEDVFNRANRNRINIDFQIFDIKKLLDDQYIMNMIKRYTINDYIKQYLK